MFFMEMSIPSSKAVESLLMIRVQQINENWISFNGSTAGVLSHDPV